MILQAFFLTIALIFMAPQVFAGSISGTALYGAEFKPPPPLKTGKFQKACGREDVPNESLQVNGKGLKNVVIALEGSDLGGEPVETSIDQKNCQYHPHVVALMKGSVLKIHSSDPINHNIHTYSFDNDPLNIMFVPGQDASEQELEEPEIIKIECDLHSWMSAWVVVTENPYFAVSGDKGEFTIANVPPGEYTLTAWHETLGSLSREVKVDEGDAKIDFDFSNISPQLSKK